MVANTSSGSSMRGVVNYLSNPDKMEWSVTRNTPTDDLQLAAKQIDKVVDKAKANGETKIKKHVYHVSLSWDEFDAPTKGQMVDVGDKFLSHMGLDERQAVMVCHGDRNHPHLHIAVCKLHPVTNEKWEKYLYHGQGRCRQVKQTDYQRIEDFERRIEREYRWEVVPGKHVGKNYKSFDSPAPRVWEIKQGDKIQEIARIGGVDLANGRSVKVRADELTDRLYDAKSFAEFDKILAENGLWIKAEGQGAVITDGINPRKASDVSRGLSGPKLEARFGQPLKDYVNERGTIVEQSGGEEILEDWLKYKAKNDLERLAGEHMHNPEAFLDDLAAYDSQLNAITTKIEQGFAEGFVGGVKVYKNFSAFAEANSLAQANSRLQVRPAYFGPVNDPDGILTATEGLRAYVQLQGKYADHITRMSQPQRDYHKNALNLYVSRGRGMIEYELKNAVRQHFKSGLHETESGRAIDRSVVNTIRLSKTLNKAMKAPAKLSRAAMNEVNMQFRNKAAGESGQAVGQLSNEGVKYLKSLSHFMRNPVGGTTRMIKSVIQSSINQLKQVERSRGLER